MASKLQKTQEIVSEESKSPEYNTLCKCYTFLLHQIELQPQEYCDLLFQEQFILPHVKEHVRNQAYVNSDKARLLLDAVIAHIENKPAEYPRFVTCVLESIGNNEDIIMHIQKVYEEECSSPSSDHSISDPSICGFVCPYCKECSIETFFSPVGCPLKREPNLFPFLDISGLNEDEKEHVMARLRFDTQDIIRAFNELIDNFKISLEERKVPVDEVVYSVVKLEALIAVDGVDMLESRDKQICENSTSFTTIFTVLIRYYMSFFNFTILEDLIAHHGSPDDKQRLFKYISDLDEFCHRSVFEVPSNIFSANQRNDRDLVVKCTDKIITMKNVRKIGERVAKILELNKACSTAT